MPTLSTRLICVLLPARPADHSGEMGLQYDNEQAAERLLSPFPACPYGLDVSSIAQRDDTLDPPRRRPSLEPVAGFPVGRFRADRRRTCRPEIKVPSSDSSSTSEPSR